MPPKNTCGRNTINGTPCKRSPGWGTNHPGEGPCRLHDNTTTPAKTPAPPRPAQDKPRQPKPSHRKKQPRDGNGGFLTTNASVQRAAAATSLRSAGATYQEIADQLGYADRGHAWRAVQQARRQILREPAEELIQVEAERLDDMYVAALEVLEAEHLMVSHGKIVVTEDGVPLRDTGPRLAALREMRHIRESYRKLHGLDAPQRTQTALSGTVSLSELLALADTEAEDT
ncbi:hypothetical protein [Streptomyces sp. Iso 434]|uniref:hypothetical protein n=1 Tax=Streptomyces sp. Iso 434 TaxID=3062272 RepID=UPI00397EE93D